MNQTHILTRNDLWSLEDYASKRSTYRTQVMQHKKNRQVSIGENATLYFEDRTTIQYQIQEMLRIEKIFESDGITEELETYNPMIPSGNNWKATFMIEYADPEIRAVQLAKMRGIEELVWVQIEDFDKVWTISNEDLERTNDSKTSSVHFMRFELTADMISAAKQGVNISMGVEHSAYNHRTLLDEATRNSLVNDLN